MIRKVLIVALATLVNFFSLHCQHVLDSIKIRSDQNIEISGMAFKDSIFLNVHGDFSTSLYWLPRNGSKYPISLPELSTKTIIGITKNQGEITYYYLAKNAKTMRVSSVTVSQEEQAKYSTEPTEIDGRFIGCYVDRNLHILTFNKKNKFLLTDTEIKGTEIIHESSYVLSIDLADYPQNQIAFISDEMQISPSKAGALVKIYNRSKEIIIVSDNPFGDLTSGQDFFLTNIIRIDKNTGKSSTQSKFEKRKGAFRSFLWKDYLIRMVYEDFNNGVELSLYQLTDLKQRIIQHLSFDELNDISRSDENLQTVRVQKKNLNRGGVPFILADTLNNKLILTIGSYWEIKGHIPALPILGLAGALSSLFINGVLQEIGTGSLVQRYTYLSSDLVHDFKPLKNETFHRKILDDFEISKIEQKTKYTFKGYMKFGGTLLGFYKGKKSDFLKILVF